MADCVLNQVGKPVYYREADSSIEWGSWMQDASPKTGEDAMKFWMTRENDTEKLYEYSSRDRFRHKSVTKIHQLESGYDGNSHVVYGGAFYYSEFETNRIIRLDLTSNKSSHRALDDVSFSPSIHKLYETQLSYMDFNADENGLWVIFSPNTTNNTLIVKIDPITLSTENVWNITLDHQMMGEMFIACGILYGVESTTDTFTKIRFAFDLYQNTPIPELNVNFTNPFRQNTMISYNPRYEQLYAWDAKNLIVYPIRFADDFLEIVQSSNSTESGDDELK